MTVTPDMIHKLATLARLKLTPEEEAAFSTQVPKIIGYVDQLQHVTTDRVPPTDTEPSELRSDAAHPAGIADEILDRAPSRSDRFWSVPPVQ